MIPNPKDYKNEKDFMAACVPMVSDEHPDWDNDQCVAACYSMWRDRNKHKHSLGRELITMSANLMCHSVSNNDTGVLNIDTDNSVILTGDKTFNGVYFPKEELEKTYIMWDKVPINIDHSDEKIEDIVGYVESPQYINDKIVVKPIIDSDTSKYNTAMGFIKSRMKAGRVPNVSVGVWIDRFEEEMEDGKTRLTARNLEPDHLALVVKGACSPEDGCGIGIGLSDDETIHKPEGEIVIPVTPSSEPPITVVVSFEDYVDNDKAYNDLEIEILKEKIKLEKEKLKHD